MQMSVGQATTVMDLTVAATVATARTELSAFDRALVEVGAPNYNLVRLSSVIPPGSVVTVVPRLPDLPAACWGDRLYVVYAHQSASRRGQQAWAGVGWVQDECTGRGLFVEHEGEHEGEVRERIRTSLEDLQQSRGIALGPIESVVVGTECDDQPCCALVLCAFDAEPWRREPRGVGGQPSEVRRSSEAGRPTRVGLRTSAAVQTSDGRTVTSASGAGPRV